MLKTCPRCSNSEIGKEDNYCKICGFGLIHLKMEKVEVNPETTAATAASVKLQPKMLWEFHFYEFPDLNEHELDDLTMDMTMALGRTLQEWKNANGHSNK